MTRHFLAFACLYFGLATANFAQELPQPESQPTAAAALAAPADSEPEINLADENAELAHVRKHVARIQTRLEEKSISGVTASHKVLIELLRWEIDRAAERLAWVPGGHSVAAAKRLSRLREILAAFDNYTFPKEKNAEAVAKFALFEEMAALLQADLEMWQTQLGPVPETEEERQLKARQ